VKTTSTSAHQLEFWANTHKSTPNPNVPPWCDAKISTQNIKRRHFGHARPGFGESTSPSSRVWGRDYQLTQLEATNTTMKFTNHMWTEGQISESYRRADLSNRFSLRSRRSRCLQRGIPPLKQPEVDTGRQRREWDGDVLPKQQVSGADHGVARGPARIRQCHRSMKQHEGGRRPTVEILE
jgi:hypothetical protein